MKKLAFAAFGALLMIMLASCSPKTEKTVGNAPFFVNHHFDFVECDNVIYFVEEVGRASEQEGTTLLSYRFAALDIETCECMPLCFKPDCTHEGKDCGAYVSADGVSLTLYNGRLYWIEGGFRNPILYSMNTDGSDRKRETAVDAELYRLAYGMGTAEIADDTLYICGTAENVNNGEVVRSAVVFRQPLGKSKGELIFREDICAEVFGRITEGKLFFAVSEEFSEDEEKPLETRLFSYSIQSGELEELYSHSEPGIYYRYLIAENGKVYLFGYANGLIYTCESGGVSTFRSEGWTSIDVGDGYCICWETKGKYTLCDLQGNELYSGVFPPENDSSFPNAHWGRTFIGSSGKKLFYQITFIGQDVPTITQIVEFDTEAHSVKALFDSRKKGL